MAIEKQVIAVTSHYWGRGDNPVEALKVLKRQRPNILKRFVVFYEAPKGTTINDLGNFVHYPPEGKTWDDLTPEEAAAYTTVRPIPVKGAFNLARSKK